MPSVGDLLNKSLLRKVSVSKVIIHLDYNTTEHWRDIALLKLTERVDLFDFPPACLPGQDETFNERRGRVYGKAFSLDIYLLCYVKTNINMNHFLTLY